MTHIPEPESRELNPWSAQELYDEWETCGYDVAGSITPELVVEWSVMHRLCDGSLAADRKLSLDLEDLIREGDFEGPFVYWGDGRPSLHWHDSLPEDPNRAPRTDPRELAILELGVECAKEAHGVFKELELEPVPEAKEGDFSEWVAAAARNAEVIDKLVKGQFPYLKGWQPGFDYFEARVRKAKDKIEPYPR